MREGINVNGMEDVKANVQVINKIPYLGMETLNSSGALLCDL